MQLDNLMYQLLSIHKIKPNTGDPKLGCQLPQQGRCIGVYTLHHLSAYACANVYLFHYVEKLRRMFQHWERAHYF